jgi:Mg/Co/Ni transporter MgtE
MKNLKKLFKNELLILLLNAVVMHTVFVAVVLSVYQGAPEVLADSGLQIVLEVFEGEA